MGVSPKVYVYVTRPLAPKMREGELLNVSAIIISPSLLVRRVDTGGRGGVWGGGRVKYSTGGYGVVDSCQRWHYAMGENFDFVKKLRAIVPGRYR